MLLVQHDPARRAQGCSFCVEVPERSREGHGAVSIKAMCKSARVADFVKSFNDKPLCRKAGIRRKAVEILTQPRERNHRHTSFQLRLPKHKTHHGNKEIHFCDPEQSVSCVRFRGQKRPKDQLGIILVPKPVKGAGRQRNGKPGAGSEAEFIVHGRFHRVDVSALYLAERCTSEQTHACVSFLRAPLVSGPEPFSNGIMTVNVVPLPTSLSTWMSP